MRLHILAASVFFLVSFSTQAETVLRTRLNADIISTDPGVRRDENTDGVMMHIVEGLVASRNDGSVGPMLADRWDVTDGGRVYTFHLRQGIVFHNGQPLAAGDVLWSLKRYLDPETRWRCRREFGDNGIGNVVQLDAPDPYTVVIALDRPAPMLLKTLARADCGGTGIVHRDSVDAAGNWRSPIGTGPFRLGEWRRNQSVELLKFDDYQPLTGPPDGNAGGKAVLVDRAIFMVIPDGSAARTALLRGSIDVLDNLRPSDVADLENKSGIRLDLAPTMDCSALLFQTKDPVLADPRIRTAIALTLDTAKFVKALTWGTGQPNNSAVPASSPYFGPVEQALRAPDLDRARALLTNAGYRGEPLRILTNNRYSQMFDAAVLIQAMAARAGIVMEIETLDWATQLARYNSGNYQTMSFAYSARLDPALSFGALIGDKTRNPSKVWDSPQANALLRRSLETADESQRQSAFDELHRLFMEETPAVILYNSARITALRNAVVGYRNWAAAQPRLWNVGLEETR